MQLLCIKGLQWVVILLPKEGVSFHHHSIVALPVQQHSTTSAWFLMATSTINYALMLHGDGLTMIGKREFFKIEHFIKQGQGSKVQ